MNQHRIAAASLAALCLGALGACHRSGELTDAQITRLLHTQPSQATDPNAPIDPLAVTCLRAWSGDTELTASLPPAAQAMKDGCRRRVETWIADATRNPDKVTFEQASAAPNVRRAMALLAQHRMANMHTPQQQDRPPGAMMSQTPPGTPGAATPPAAEAPAGPVDLSAATDAVNQLDGLCQKAKALAASGEKTDKTELVARYANFCDKRIESLRNRIETVQASGNAQQAQMLTNNVQRTLQGARQLEASATGTPPPQQPPAQPSKN